MVNKNQLIVPKIPSLEVRQFGDRSGDLPKAIFTPTGEGKKIKMRFADMVRYYTIDELCGIVRNVKYKVLHLHHQNNLVFDFWTNDFRKMVKAVCAWYVKFKKQLKIVGEKPKEASYVRHSKHRLSVNY